MLTEIWPSFVCLMKRKDWAILRWKMTMMKSNWPIKMTKTWAQLLISLESIVNRFKMKTKQVAMIILMKMNQISKIKNKKDSNNIQKTLWYQIAITAKIQKKTKVSTPVLSKIYMNLSQKTIFPKGHSEILKPSWLTRLKIYLSKFPVKKLSIPSKKLIRLHPNKAFTPKVKRFLNQNHLLVNFIPIYMKLNLKRLSKYKDWTKVPNMKLFMLINRAKIISPTIEISVKHQKEGKSTKNQEFQILGPKIH